MAAKASITIVNPYEGTIDRIMSTGEVRLNIGCKHPRGYTIITYYKKNFLRHRFIYAHFHGPIAPWMEIDHIHGIEAGDGIQNLRWVTKNGNMQNLRKATAQNRSSGLLGVTWDKARSRWKAQIDVNGVHVNIGRYKTVEEAREAYLSTKRRLHPTCTI